MKTDRVRPIECGERVVQLETQIKRLTRRETVLGGISNKYWRARRIALAAGILLTIALFELAGDRAGLLSLLISAAGFAAIAHFHGKVLASMHRNGAWIGIKRQQIARIRLDWNHMPRPGQSGNIHGHPFELDLDITGENSL